jgi:hypothetical protein
MSVVGTSLRATSLAAAVGALLVLGPAALAAAPSDDTGSVRITGEEGTGIGSDSVRITGDASDNRDF